MKRGVRLAMAALALALLLPEGAQRGGLGLETGFALALGLLALAAWLLLRAGVLDGATTKKSARACGRGSDAAAAQRQAERN